MSAENRCRALFVLGTRPEAIKLAPLIRVFEQETGSFVVKVCSTGQHLEMLRQVLDFFRITIDYDLDVMAAGQSLSGMTARILLQIEAVLADFRPDLIVVQGDTTSAFVGALAGYYHRVAIAHVEAGLRSHRKDAPYPEELNRAMISRLADYHLIPTAAAEANLRAEGIHENSCVTGNTIVDSLMMAKEIVAQDEQVYREAFPMLERAGKIILITGHRRESFGLPLREICLALRDIAEANGDCLICYPVHLNPKVKEPVEQLLSGVENVLLLPPLSYPHFVYLMTRSFLILTDSGGIQEEAPTLGKPVLVTREVTERMEGVAAGNAQLVGTQRAAIVSAVSSLLNDPVRYRAMAEASNPYGDGTASRRILEFLRDRLVDRRPPQGS